MAKGGRVLGLTAPEKLAQRLLIKHSLKVPFDLLELVEKYARVIYEDIPIQGVDGVTLNLKIPRKKTLVIVNKQLSKTRQLFTLAHELGHIIIPWHIGTIADEIDIKGFSNNMLSISSNADLDYKILEQEANSFAAELLMPSSWINSLLESGDTLSAIHKKICETIGVSIHATAIQMGNVLPTNIVFCAEQNSTVKFSGRTSYTTAPLQKINNTFEKNYYHSFDEYSKLKGNSITVHWWKLSSKMKHAKRDSRTWREVLNEILLDINSIEEERANLKGSINGVVSAANGKIKKANEYSKESLLTAMFYSLSRPELKDFTNHNLFKLYLDKRAEDFLKKNLKK